MLTNYVYLFSSEYKKVTSIIVIIYHVVIIGLHVDKVHIVFFVHLLQCLICLASVEECYSTQITTALSGTTKYHNVHNEEDALRKTSRTNYALALSQNRLLSFLDHSFRFYHTIQYNTIQYNTIQCNTIQYNAMQCNATQRNAAQRNATQHNTIQYNTIYFNFHTCQ